jgi:hypothetical protein
MLNHSLHLYINAGAAWRGISEDINRDGRQESIFACYNNRLSTSAILILGEHKWSGASPPYTNEDCDLTWVEKGNQLVYIVFAPTDLFQYYSFPYIEINEIYRDSDSSIIIHTIEYQSDEIKPCGIRYHLGRNLRIFHAEPDDVFAAQREKLIRESKLKDIPDFEYYDSLLKSVRYYHDTGWVTEAQLRALKKY